MLENVTSGDFSPFLGEVIAVRDEAGNAFALTVHEVRDNPQFRLDLEDETARIPFRVLLMGPLDPALPSGSVTVDLPDGQSLEGVAVQRIVPPNGKINSAWYQIVFC